MDTDHFLFFSFAFLCYSFGIFSIGYIAGQQSLMESIKRTRKKRKEIDIDHERWLEDIKRN
jgi:hypothetical protein